MPLISREPAFVKAPSKVVGLDVFIQSNLTAEELGKSLEQLVLNSPVQLKMISNRGVKVYPLTGTSTDVVDLWSCRLMAKDQSELNDHLICTLLEEIGRSHAWMHLEKLTYFGERMGFTKAQGED